MKCSCRLMPSLRQSVAIKTRACAGHFRDPLLAQVVGVFAGHDAQVELGKLAFAAPAPAARPRSSPFRCSGRR